MSASKVDAGLGRHELFFSAGRRATPQPSDGWWEGWGGTPSLPREPYSSADLPHGPIAMLDRDLPGLRTITLNC